MSLRAERYLSFVQQARAYNSAYPVVAPLRDNGGQFFNVKSYGAKGDGLTDDSTAIQSAINAIGTNGGTIFIPDGTYLLKSSLSISKSNTRINCSGGAAGNKMAFWGQTPIVQPVLATGAGHTVDDVIAVLQNLGLVRQS